MRSCTPILALSLLSLLLVGCAEERYVKLTVHSDPPGAEIFREETYLGVAPLTRSWSTKDPNDGSHPAKELDLGDFYAKKAGYQEAHKRVRLNIPQGNYGPGFSRSGYYAYYETEITISLTETPPLAPLQQQQQQQQQQTVIVPGTTSSEDKGTLMVTSNVESCDVYVDGMFVGNTPSTLRLSDGIHIIEIKKQGYGDYRKEFRVYADSELVLRATLNKR